MCDIYAMVGSLCGCTSIWTMTAIALDRYNVIVKVCIICFYINIVNGSETKLNKSFQGMAGKPLTIKKALLEILIIWLFASIWTILPMLGWNR